MRDNKVVYYTTGRRGGGRITRNQGENVTYCMDVAPMNMFENQVVPLEFHKLSRSLRPNVRTARVFLSGTKFIPVQKKHENQKTFCEV